MVNESSRSVLQESINKLRSDKDFYGTKIGTINTSIDSLKAEKDRLQNIIQEINSKIDDLQEDLA